MWKMERGPASLLSIQAHPSSNSDHRDWSHQSLYTHSGCCSVNHSASSCLLLWILFAQVSGQPPPHPSDLKPSGIYVLISLPGITFSVALCVLSNEPLFLKCIWKEHVSIPVFNLPFKSRNWVHSAWIPPPPPHCCTISMVSKVCFKNEDNRR